jgi:hypothetical protein
MPNTIKISLAALFFFCLADLPYGYFQFVRLAALIGFGVLAFHANEVGKQNEMILYIVLAILFQPIYKIALGRELWNVVDIVVGLGLLISIFLNRENKSKT